MWWWIVSAIVIVITILLVLFLSGVPKDDDEDPLEGPVIKIWNNDDDISIGTMTERVEPEIDEEDKR